MRKVLASFGVAWTMICGGPASGQMSVYDLLEDNPELAAAAESHQAAKADLSAARGARLPQLRVEGQIGRQGQSFTLPIDGRDQSFDQTTDPRAVRASLEQVIFTSGVLSGAIGAAKSSVESAGHAEMATRQNVVLAGARAMANLVSARGVLSVRLKNELVIQQRLDESQARFDAGLATRTDVLQSESRLAAATADRVNAESLLRSAEENFLRVFGQTPPAILALPILPGELPIDLEEAVRLAELDGPIMAAQKSEADAAGFAVREARGRALPQVSLSAEAVTAFDQPVAQLVADTESYGVFLNVSVDLFSGGSNRARTKAAKFRARAAKSQLEVRRREVRQSMIDNWTTRRTALAALEARNRQVIAARKSRDGVVREAEANRRTRLDILDAELELANAQVSQLEADRDAIVAGFAILALVGRL